MKNNLNKLEIGERIRSIRDSLFMSRERFSEKLDISEVFLGQLERGESFMSLKTLAAFVNYTGFSADYILFGDERNNSNLQRIDNILKNSSDDTINLIYNIVNNVYNYNEKIGK